jgi:glycosyltransferase involved in cell wall biosynthesis
MQVKVSVVIPCYNGEKYLDQALQSLTQQTVQPHEVLLIDDGSTDNSLEIARQYSPRIHQVTMNMGIGYARHRGMELATGTHVAFLSTDDYWAPKFLEHSIEGLSQYAAIYMGYTFINENQEITGKFEPPDFSVNTVIDWALKKNMFVNFSAILIPVLEFPSFNIGMKYGEDIVFLLDTVITGLHWGRLDHSDVYYRVHSEMGTKQLTLRHFEQTWKEVTLRLMALGVSSKEVNEAQKASYNKHFAFKHKIFRMMYQGLRKIKS